VAAARIDIDAALASLPLEFRTAVVLRDVCDLPYDEISDILGVPVGTVRSRIARARSALAATWRSDESEHVAGDPITARSDGNSSDPSIVKTADDDRRGATPSGRSQEEERTP
jgi:RNA polymerase sigma-70 factor (ECF subfamily)